MPTPFITPTDIVQYLGRGDVNDPGFLMAADAACDIVRRVTSQDFNRGTTTITMDGSGGDSMLLPQVPVNSVGTVSVNGGSVSDYVLDAENGILFRGTAGIDPRPTWPSGRQNVRLTYDHGYSDADLPRDVRRVAIEVAARTALQGPLIEQYVGPVRARYAAASTELTSTELLILHRHRARGR